MCGLTILAVLATGLSADAQETGDLERLRQHALSLVNEARSEEGLSEVSLDTILNEAAQSHAADMVERDFYAHVGPDGGTPRDRFRDAGGSRWALSGENIAKCSNCALPPDIERLDAFHSGWMQSPEHRENILSEGFDRFGFGVSGEGDEIYAVQTFAGPGAALDGPALTLEEARATALEAINARRMESGLDAIELSDPLNTLADRVLETRLAGEDLPQNTFDLLPAGSTGWTSLSILTASRGGAGSSLSRSSVETIVKGWTEQRSATALGGSDATHLGFAAEAQENGRMTAVAVFGGQG